MIDRFDYSLRYFELHAKQRISTFNFFVVLSAFLTTAFVATCQKDFSYPSMSALVSLIIMLVSVIFWKLDQRVRFLIQHAESVLELLEKGGSDQVALFSEEREKTKKEKGGVWQGIVNEQLSYSQCFGFMYAIFFVFGVIGCFYSFSDLLS